MTLAQNPCVLVIESDEKLANQLSSDLKEIGYEPVLASDTTSGLQHSRDRHPALIVVDRMLAGESGISLCKNLRISGVCAPVLMLMARDSVDDRVACLEAGADD